MKHYCDIILLPDAEANLGFLWQKVYQQIHLVLVENKVGENHSLVAISFPEYSSKAFPLGTKLRLLAEEATLLEGLNLSRWLSRLTDYCHYTSVKPISAVTGHAVFKRKQFNSNVERLVRRRAKRKNESYEQAMAHFEGFEIEQSDLPYINSQSLSKDERFRLFIQQDKHQNNVAGTFDCYGLSKTATVPLF
jgi:CRISPR-associated endonuclease Csy4